MSIIYDALKKTQEQREIQQKNKVISYLLPTIFILILISGLGFSTYYFFPRPLFSIRHFFISAPKKIDVPMKLNGIYISGYRKLAMINQQLYSLGSSINNMKIVKIEDNAILLEDNQQHKKILSLS